MEKLAINGGVPVRSTKLYYGRQWITEEDAEEIKKTALSDFVTCGPKVDELEKKLCEYTGAKYAVACTNDTSALHIAALAAGVGPGDEIITTPLTFMASSNCALYCGATPVFADVDPITYNIDPQSIEEHITPRTKAVVAVDYTGQVVDIDAIRKICDKHNLILIEDAAHSIGSKYNGKMVGTLADMTCFSFHPVKTVTAGEGGAILTDNKEYYEKLKLLRSHGMEHDASKMIDGIPEGPWYYEQQMLGFNYRMTDLQAALLCSQLNKIDMFVKRRKEIVAKYNEAFKDMPEIICPQDIKESDSSRHLYVIRLNFDKLSCSRREFFDALGAENIICQIHYIPVYYFPYYRSLGYNKGLCPNAEKIYEGIMSIPLYPKMTDRDVEDVICAVKKVVENYRKN
ncbi:UDP-4-amino-4,6-dideoxy-N-acetyl-beta-L-altrosamine transaminase [Butyrivibrio sp. NC3005]|uniref:UDP-4-amino-4, 6-dideoxy-N-acetyl-beta-L-altrosamine transaminase n=1 Tax=Butyrivibrio sp. NC3005 TaxID=1280685 RepID=UPI0004259155|nr:UDP-4-amino-4,6-dideoxy-N-acetyl-beta-L-altrosamine transaminase [Butyrivibrio sp. NC3005]